MNIFDRETAARSLAQVEETFQDVIIGAEDRSRIIQLAFTTRNTKKLQVLLRETALPLVASNDKTLYLRINRCRFVMYFYMVLQAQGKL